MVKIFSIEGNIGSGKSTIIKRLQENFEGIIYLPEPVDLWNQIKDSQGVTILEKFYKDKKGYSFSFQMMAYITRFNQIKKVINESPPDSIIITERCLYTDRYVFAKMLYDTGFMEEIEYTIYNSFFEEIKISGIIYIKTTPEICSARIVHRGRKGEESINLDYLKDCHQYHEDWLNNFEISKIVLDGNFQIDINFINEFVKKT
jgi:deoxyadenosine/deoxycytidine kinase